MNAAELIILLLLAIGLAAVYRHERAALKARRARMFESCLALLDEYRVTQDGVGFPVLTGAYRGHRVCIEPLPDDLAYRKIPSLWLRATLLRELPLAGAIDVVARAHNGTFFSAAADLPQQLAVPRAWPPQLTLKASRASAACELDTLSTHVQSLFADPRAKELLVTQRGVRIVWLAHSGERSHYLALRATAFRTPGIAPHLLASLLDRAIALSGDITAGGTTHAHA